MTHSSPTPPPSADLTPEDLDEDDAGPACVLVFNASDPSGAGGLAAGVSSAKGTMDTPVSTRNACDA